MLPLQPTYQRRAPQRHRSEGFGVPVGHTWNSVFDAGRATFRPLPRIFFTAFQFQHGVIRKSGTLRYPSRRGQLTGPLYGHGAVGRWHARSLAQTGAPRCGSGRLPAMGKRKPPENY